MERAKARQTSFAPVTLKDATFSLKVPVQTENLKSQNVLAKITGAKQPDQSVMFGAHWDAFGTSTNAEGQMVMRRGAIDDGSGIAGVLEIARVQGWATAGPDCRVCCVDSGRARAVGLSLVCHTPIGFS